jgi:hypothetical protein
MAFGETFAIGSDHEWNVGIPRVWEPEKFLNVHLTRSRHEEIVAAHDLPDLLPRIVHHHRKVVGGHAIVSTEHDIIDSPFDFADQQIDEPVTLAGGAQPKGRWPALLLPGPAFGAGEVSAGSRIRTLG